jgi:hypothetical protein
VLELAGVPIDPEALLPVVTAVAGYLTERGRLPDPPGLPTLRAFQRAQGAVARAWLRRLLPTPAQVCGDRSEHLWWRSPVRILDGGRGSLALEQERGNR